MEQVTVHRGRPQLDAPEPAAEIILTPSDTILVIAPIEALLKLEEMNNSGNAKDGKAVDRALAVEYVGPAERPNDPTTA